MKAESKVPISTILAKLAECFGLRTLPVVYVTYFTDKDIILSCVLYTSARFMSKELSHCTTQRLPIYPHIVSDTLHPCLQDNPMDKFLYF